MPHHLYLTPQGAVMRADLPEWRDPDACVPGLAASLGALPEPLHLSPAAEIGMWNDPAYLTTGRDLNIVGSVLALRHGAVSRAYYGPLLITATPPSPAGRTPIPPLAKKRREPIEAELNAIRTALAGDGEHAVNTPLYLSLAETVRTWHGLYYPRGTT